MSYRLPGLPNVTPVGNVGTGEDNLMGYSIPAGLMSRDGDRIEFRGVFTENASATAGIKIDAQSVATLGIGTHTSWPFTFTRLTATTASFYDWQNFDGSVLTGLDFTAPIVVQFTGEGTNNDDIVQTYLGGEFYPASGQRDAW